MKRITTSAKQHRVEPRTISQSERAKKQPRDSRGRFAKYESVMVLDEFGNPGLNPSRGERYFGYGVSVTREPEKFAAATDDNRFHYQSERKARDDPIPKREQISRRIAGTDTDTYGYYIDKREPPKEWYGEDRAKIMTDTMEYAVKSTLPETDGSVLVVVDDHKSYRGKTEKVVKDLSTPWKKVEGGAFDSSNSEYADLLQSQDYVANAVRSNLETGDKKRTWILKTRMHRIRNRELRD